MTLYEKHRPVHTILLISISCLSCRSSAQDGVLPTDTTAHTEVVTKTMDTAEESAMVRQYSICIVDADGGVLAQDRVDDLSRYPSDPDFYIHETEDGQTAILVNYYRQVTCRYLFDDMTLTRETEIDTSSQPVQSACMKYLGDGIYISLSRAENGTKLDFSRCSAGFRAWRSEHGLGHQ